MTATWVLVLYLAGSGSSAAPNTMTVIPMQSRADCEAAVEAAKEQQPRRYVFHLCLDTGGSKR